MSKKRYLGGTRTKIWARATGVFLLLVVCLVVAFPQIWNRWSFLPDLSIPDFRLGLDLKGGAHLVYEAEMTQIPDADRVDALEGVRDVIERRVNAFGVAEPLVQTNVNDGHYRIVIELAGVLDVQEAIVQIGETPILEFREVNPDYVQGQGLTPEQQAQIDAANVGESAAAAAVLEQAKSGEDFGALVDANTIVINEKAYDGALGGVVVGGIYDAAIADVEAGLNVGEVLPRLYETPNGYEILKLTGREVGQNEMQLSHILICYASVTGCTEDRDPLSAKALAEQILSEVTPENFADKATEYSNDPGSNKDGGDLGFIRPGTTVEAFDAAAQAVAIGQIYNQVVETEFGFHIIYKRGERPYTAYQFQRIIMKRTDESDLAPYAEWKNTDLSGKQLQSAQVQFDQNTNAPLVALNFDAEGGELFEALTERNINKQIAIFLDGEIISAPTVQAKISGGQAVITGRFTLDEAKLLAQRLNAGALPVPVTLVSQQTVGPTLGQESLAKSIEAGLIGLALVALFMILYYRLPGALAVLALLGYAAINLMLYKLLGVTMSLSGIAGFVLSIGIAVDANVLIFERLREELRSGRDLPTAITEGFSRAWPSIRDGHATILISSLILFWFSTSFIKGFALTLTIGTLVSLFSAITVTRAYMRVVEGWGWVRRHPWLFGVKKQS